MNAVPPLGFLVTITCASAGAALASESPAPFAIALVLGILVWLAAGLRRGKGI